MRILIDIDGTVLDSLPVWLGILNDRYGLNGTPADITRWELDKCPPYDTLSENQIYGVLNEESFHDRLCHFEGAPEAIKRMHENGQEVYFVTARNGQVSVRAAQKWFKEHYPYLRRDRLVFCGDKHIIKADLLIDDRAENLTDYMSHWPYAKATGLRTAYNQTLAVSSFWPFQLHSNWSEILSYVESLTRPR